LSCTAITTCSRARYPYRNPSALRRVLCRIVEEVGQHLDQAVGVAQDRCAGCIAFDRQHMPARSEQGLRLLHRTGDEDHRIEHRAVDLDQATRDARDIEQVVDQRGQVADLAADDAAGLPDAVFVGGPESEQLRRRRDRRERIAQLVGEHCQELVLAPVLFLQRLVEAGVL
jgi:hypothetical protein